MAKRLVEMTRKRAKELEEQFEPEYFPPLDGTETPVSEWLKNPPPPRDYLFEEVLPARIVGGVVAVGGTGKGFFILQMGLSLATGQKIGPLEPARKFKVLYLAGEDDQKEILRRTISSVKVLWPAAPPPEIDNFIPVSVMGKLGPLMQFDAARNPVNVPAAYDWLCKTLENLPEVEVLILDPKSKFYGLDENDNRPLRRLDQLPGVPCRPASRSPSSFPTTRARLWPGA